MSTTRPASPSSTGTTDVPRFAGLLCRAIDVDDAQLAALYGPAHGVQGRFAVGGCPPGAHRSASLGIIVSAVSLLARGALAGAYTPSPFFGADGRPVVEALVLDPETRWALADAVVSAD